MNDSISPLLKALANPRRIEVVRCLMNRELSVNQMLDEIDLSQSALSQHLAKLRDGGVVKTRRSSQRIYYQLAEGRIAKFVELLDRLYGRGVSMDGSTKTFLRLSTDLPEFSQN